MERAAVELQSFSILQLKVWGLLLFPSSSSFFFSPLNVPLPFHNNLRTKICNV